MTQPRTALVIGGGIAGPVAAMALQRGRHPGHRVRGPPRGAEGIGIFLTLASNGIDALRTIDADPPAVAAGFPTPGIVLRSLHRQGPGHGPHRPVAARRHPATR